MTLLSAPTPKSTARAVGRRAGGEGRGGNVFGDVGLAGGLSPCSDPLSLVVWSVTLMSCEKDVD